MRLETPAEVRRWAWQDEAFSWFRGALCRELREFPRGPFHTPQEITRCITTPLSIIARRLAAQL